MDKDFEWLVNNSRNPEKEVIHLLKMLGFYKTALAYERITADASAKKHKFKRKCKHT